MVNEPRLSASADVESQALQHASQNQLAIKAPMADTEFSLHSESTSISTHRSSLPHCALVTALLSLLLVRTSFASIAAQVYLNWMATCYSHTCFIWSFCYLKEVRTLAKLTIGDTCTAMNEWVHYPHTETALSNILPCVDLKTTNRTLYQSKEVILQLVSVVNSVIRSVANSNNASSKSSVFFNQSGAEMPLLCSPYDSKLQLRHCQPHEVSFSNASLV
ncbi:hypothetical protein MA16_Dca021089 [Dendrobium catenatum]|uniref:Uncharacterized protein n=1 Tax=Dendrobium catenatum TaxID=906689 RepID=A0A2I0VXX5_9ASPA|nr:hypothetical protein MA16_Dca021089 [Dendrobium catenatum]